MDELQDNTLEIPFSFIFLGNLDEAINYLLSFIKKINLQMSIPYDAVSPRDASRPWTIGTDYDPLRSLRITRLDILPWQPQNGSERFELETRIIGNDGTTTVLHAGVLKLTQLTTGKTRIEYFELSSLMRDDLKLIWQELINLLEHERLYVASAPQRLEERDRPDWFPKRAVTLERWKRAWKKIRITQDDYKKMYDDMMLENPEPSLAELSDAVAHEIGKSYSNSTVANIKRAGQMGWLD